MTEIGTTLAPAGYRLGDTIALEDFLALPPDGRRYARTDEGRLEFGTPDSPSRHRYPLSRVSACLSRSLTPDLKVITGPGIALPRIFRLGGGLVPPSRLGPMMLEPDVAVFGGTPRIVGEAFTPERLLLVVEVLSRSTARNDLGLGAADAVDRLRSYFESGVPEYWVINPTPERMGLPPRSALLLTRGDGAWSSLEGEGLQLADERVQGCFPLLGGRVRSSALPGVTLDLDAYWRDAAEVGDA